MTWRTYTFENAERSTAGYALVCIRTSIIYTRTATGADDNVVKTLFTLPYIVIRVLEYITVYEKTLLSSSL